MNEECKHYVPSEGVIVSTPLGANFLAALEKAVLEKMTDGKDPHEWVINMAAAQVTAQVKSALADAITAKLKEEITSNIIEMLRPVINTASEREAAKAAERILGKGKKEGEEQLIKDTLELSVRTTKCLERVGIITMSRLVSCQEKDLLRIPNFGRVCLREVLGELATHNLKLQER